MPGGGDLIKQTYTHQYIHSHTPIHSYTQTDRSTLINRETHPYSHKAILRNTHTHTHTHTVRENYITKTKRTHTHTHTQERTLFLEVNKYVGLTHMDRRVRQAKQHPV